MNGGHLQCAVPNGRAGVPLLTVTLDIQTTGIYDDPFIALRALCAWKRAKETRRDDWSVW